MMSDSQRGKHVGENNKLTGRKWAWINRDGIKTKVPLDDVGYFLISGWKRGIKEK
jgi:hypothetical protein